MKCPKRVLVFGGTHGNEWSGVMAVLHYGPLLQSEFPELDLQFILANPEAYAINRRFKDEDLNRAFQFLTEDRQNSYEHQRAGEIKAMITSAPCYVIDLHTTTANMGKTVILPHYNKVNLSLAAGLSQTFSDCRVIGSPDPDRKYLASQSEFSMMVEVGPVANGVVEATALESTIELLRGILAQISDDSWQRQNEIEIYEEQEDVFYPKGAEGQQAAYVHEIFQGTDFEPVEDSYIPFRKFSGENVLMKVPRKLYPIFINEAAYYPQALAFTLCERKLMKI